jgi:hypothetical protein
MKALDIAALSKAAGQTTAADTAKHMQLTSQQQHNQHLPPHTGTLTHPCIYTTPE